MGSLPAPRANEAALSRFFSGMARHLLEGTGIFLVPQGDMSWPVDSPFGLYLPFSSCLLARIAPRRLAHHPEAAQEEIALGNGFDQRRNLPARRGQADR